MTEFEAKAIHRICVTMGLGEAGRLQGKEEKGREACSQ